MSSQRRSSQVLDLLRNFRAASSETDVAIFNFLSDLDCPRSLTVWLLFSNKEYQQLVDLDIQPEGYNCPFKFRDDYTATLFLSKSNFLPLEVKKDEAAKKKFLQYEELCGLTNHRLSHPATDPLNKGSSVWLLNATKRKVEMILGDFAADEFVDKANWGPGVSTLLKGEDVSPTNKFHDERGITRGLYSLVKPWFSTAYPGWWSHLSSENQSEGFIFQAGNEIVTVPKNSKTDRVIAIEPGINLWFQKAVGTMIRRRLRRCGVDLNTQERNQQLAYLGSISSELATVDFSSASDSICKSLVEELLPRRWFVLMDSCRSHVGTQSGTPIHWNKFSSMGNGFTFELESLIFYAAALAVCEYQNVSTQDVSVFGDDVILPNSCYDLFSSFSEFLGFRVNKQKSFSSGYFRESCGSHFFDGIDCKPVFLKERLRNVQSFYKLANSIRRLAHRRNSYYGCDARLLNSWRRLFCRVPRSIRFRIPDRFGDGGFIGNFDESVPTRARDGLEGYIFTSSAEIGVTRFFEKTGLLLARLKVPSLQEHGNNYTLRGRTRTRIIRVLVQRWYNMGEWF